MLIKETVTVNGITRIHLKKQNKNPFYVEWTFFCEGGSCFGGKKHFKTLKEAKRIYDIETDALVGLD